MVHWRVILSLSMKDVAAITIAVAWLLIAAGARAVADEGAVNRLAPAERDAGWRLLFDGESFDGWRNYGAEPGTQVEGWVIEDGAMKMTRDVSLLRYVLQILNPFSDRPTLDLMTEETFGDFELSVEWKISPSGNSGIFYLVPEDAGSQPWNGGLEMQVLDNAGHRDGSTEKRRAGDLYDLKAASIDALKPVGKWNIARIRVSGDRIQHWLNDVEIVDVRRSGPAWEAMLADSKFSEIKGYGQARHGHIVLQDHGDVVWYRNISIRELPPSPTKVSGM